MQGSENGRVVTIAVDIATKFDYWYLNVKYTLKDPVDIATKFDYWYLNVKHTLKDPVDIATKFDYWYICT